MSQESNSFATRNHNNLKLMNATMKHFQRRENVYSGNAKLQTDAGGTTKTMFLNSYMIDEIASDFKLKNSSSTKINRS